MVKCPLCDSELQNEAGLKTHFRRVHLDLEKNKSLEDLDMGELMSQVEDKCYEKGVGSSLEAALANFKDKLDGVFDLKE